MNKLKMLLLTLCAGAFFFVAGTVTVQAKTADQETPSEETVCDVYSGALFGLCNAYCEAQDCGDPRQRSANRACGRLQANFIRQSGGQELDCGAPVACPCFTSNDITQDLNVCDTLEDDGAFEEPLDMDQRTYIDETFPGNSYQVSYTFETGLSCAGPNGTLLDISVDEANACRDAILEADAVLVCP